MEKQDTPEQQREKCAKFCTELLQDKHMQFVLGEMKKIGCKVPAPFFSCRPCEEQITGGYIPQIISGGPKIVVCENKLQNASQYKTTVMHEMIHAFDDCRANMDTTNCEHHACTEIRASSLSGECNAFLEFQRGNFNLAGQYEKCVKRRALLSVLTNPACAEKQATAAMEKVWSKCFNDFEPFIHRP